MGGGWVANGMGTKKTLGSNGNVHYLDMVVVSQLYMIKLIKLQTLNMSLSDFNLPQHSCKKKKKKVPWEVFSFDGTFYLPFSNTI